MTRRRLLKKLLRGAFALAVVALLGLVGLLTLLWIEHDTSVTLPAPSGPLAVSRVVETWSDSHRPDPLVPDQPTDLVVWIWYPSTGSPNQKPAEYLPADWRRALVRHQGGLMSTFLMQDLSLVHPHSVMDGPLSPEQSRYPVVILRGGLGALIAQYTTLAEDLASHGYVVVGFDAPYRTVLVVYPDGRVVTRPPSLNPETLSGEAKVRLATRLLSAWVSDIGFVLDRLDQLNASTSSDRLPRSRMALTVRGANHFTFSDDLLIRPRALLRMMRMAGVLGLEPRRGFAISAESVRRFLDVHLKGAPAESLEALPTTYPELRPGLP